MVDRTGTGPAALREALRAALPRAVNFRVPLALVKDSPIWDSIADDLAAALRVSASSPDAGVSVGQAGLDAAWVRLWDDLRHNATGDPSGRAIIARHRPLIEASLRAVR